MVASGKELWAGASEEPTEIASEEEPAEVANGKKRKNRKSKKRRNRRGKKKATGVSISIEEDSTLQ